MRVIDTSLWIEIFTRGDLLEVARKAVSPLDECIIPAMVSYEIAKWSMRVLSERARQDVAGLLTKCIRAEMDESVAVEAAKLALQHNLHATDAIIYATARLMDVDLYTCDAHFEGLPGVQYSSKSST